MKNIAILHEELERPEKELEKHLLKRDNIHVKRFDIRINTFKDIMNFNPTIVLNRVYASVANRNWKMIKFSLKLIKKLEKKGIMVINSFNTTKADYSKYRAYILMKSAGIRTPKTIRYTKYLSLTNMVKKLGGYPIIVKRDSGGRGIGLAKCTSKEEMGTAIASIKNSEDYRGEIIFQEFVESIEPKDYRICIVDNEVIYYHGRELISMNSSEKPWIASKSLGSKIFPVKKEVPQDLKKFVVRATNSIGAIFDVLDVIKTKKGYTVIEHNPTPSFTFKKDYQDVLGYDPLTYVVDKILERYYARVGKEAIAETCSIMAASED